MMKFVLNHVKNGCRLGTLTEPVSSVPGADGAIRQAVDGLETPMCMLYTRAGSVPYLSRDVLDRVDGLPALVNMPLPLMMENHDTLEAYKKGIKEFCAFQGSTVYCSQHDPAMANPSGYNDKNSSAVWGRGGKFKLDVPTYIKVIRSMRADWCQLLSDSDTDVKSTRKRVIKSVDRTLNFLDDVLEKCQQSKDLEDTKWIGAIVGGHLLEERLRSAREMAQRPVMGFTMEGFHNFGPDTEKFNLCEMKEMLQKTLAVLPSDKLRILPGIQNPQNIFTAVELGFDIFDASYPYIVAERGSALVFSSFARSNPATSSTQDTGASWEISLTNKIYHDDLSPLRRACTCYTCTHHTRAYLHHLLSVSEILGNMLLMIHNLHHFLRFFEDIRQSLASDSYDKLKDHVMAQKPS